MVAVSSNTKTSSTSTTDQVNAHNAAQPSPKNSPLRSLRLQLGFFACQRTVDTWLASELKLDRFGDTKLDGPEFIKVNNAAKKIHTCLNANRNAPNDAEATLLDLRNCGLTTLPNIFGGLRLKTLDLTGNNLENLPKSLFKLEGCKILIDANVAIKSEKESPKSLLPKNSKIINDDDNDGNSNEIRIQHSNKTSRTGSNGPEFRVVFPFSEPPSAYSEGWNDTASTANPKFSAPKQRDSSNDNSIIADGATPAPQTPTTHSLKYGYWPPSFQHRHQQDNPENSQALPQNRETIGASSGFENQRLKI